MVLKIEFHREDDGQWIADIPALPGVTVYGATKDEAGRNAEALALKVLARKRELGEPIPSPIAFEAA